MIPELGEQMREDYDKSKARLFYIVGSRSDGPKQGDIQTANKPANKKNLGLFSFPCHDYSL